MKFLERLNTAIKELKLCRGKGKNSAFAHMPSAPGLALLPLWTDRPVGFPRYLPDRTKGMALN